MGPAKAAVLNSYASAAARTRGTGTSPMVSSGGTDPANIGAAMNALGSAIPAKSEPAEVVLASLLCLINGLARTRYRQAVQGHAGQAQAQANMGYLKTRYDLDDNGQPRPGSSTTDSPVKMSSADVHGPQFRDAAILRDAAEAVCLVLPALALLLRPGLVGMAHLFCCRGRSADEDSPLSLRSGEFFIGRPAHLVVGVHARMRTAGLGTAAGLRAVVRDAAVIQAVSLFHPDPGGGQGTGWSQAACRLAAGRSPW
jgi:hypothetical protein